MSIQLYLDGADLASITHYAKDPRIAGFTTNPSLLKAAGVTNYAEFGRLAAAAALGKSISFEVIGDEIDAIIRQARLISAWGSNVYVKVPVVNSRGQSMLAAVTRLALDGIKVNVTAILTGEQVKDTLKALVSATCPSIVSIFAGRIADCGMDPCVLMADAVFYRSGIATPYPPALLWASTREILNVYHAEVEGADIITMMPALYDKMRALESKNLTEYSRETVIQFLVDAQRSGLTL